MKLKEKIGILNDQIIYNIHYASKYPEEDRTSLQKEFSEIKMALTDIEGNIKSKDNKNWIRLIKANIELSEKEYNQGNLDNGREYLEEALRYLQNLSANKKIKPTFVASQDGTVEKV
jgi:hypothetical protein